MLKIWKIVASYVAKHHLNKAMARNTTDLFGDKTVINFDEILKNQQKQMCLDRFALKILGMAKHGTHYRILHLFTWEKLFRITSLSLYR